MIEWAGSCRDGDELHNGSGHIINWTGSCRGDKALHIRFRHCRAG